MFGNLSDSFGRRKLFLWTLAIYLAGTALTATVPAGGAWVIYLYATWIIAGMGAAAWTMAVLVIPISGIRLWAGEWLTTSTAISVSPSAATATVRFARTATV